MPAFVRTYGMIYMVLNSYMFYRQNGGVLKKILRRIGILLAVLLAVCIGYVIYVMVAYYRLPDNQPLTVSQSGEYAQFEDRAPVTTRKAYWVMTYNIGFGAYQRDYSFFMDGGKYSRARDEESVIADICGVGDVINNTAADFVFLQEVDIDGTRSYHVNELELLNEFVTGYYYTFAQNYDSPYLMVPPWEPHGANKAGLVTYSRGEITDALRRSLPISDSFSKFTDLDRCYSISQVPVDNGKMLCLYNVHLSAYGSSEEVRSGQLGMLFADMKADYDRGNYVICGGDFNHNLRTDASSNAPEWAQPFPREELPEGFRMGMDSLRALEDIAHDTCRNANEPYNEETTMTVTLDGFIISDNIAINYYKHSDWGYEYSDHDPVVMQFFLN